MKIRNEEYVEEYVKEGDIIDCMYSFTKMTKGKMYKAIAVNDTDWFCIDDRGGRISWSNPLSSYFRVSKNTRILKIIKDL